MTCKSPGNVPFGDDLINFGAKSDIDVSLSYQSTSMSGSSGSVNERLFKHDPDKGVKM